MTKVDRRSRPKGRPRPSEAPPADSAPTPSFHDVAALLVQMDAHDPDDRTRAQRALESLGADESIAPAARVLLAAAAGHLVAAVGGNAPQNDPVAVVDEVSRLIEAAMRLQEQSESGIQIPEAPAPNAARAAACGPVQMLPADVDVDLLRDFLTESREYVEHAEAALLALESVPADEEAINTVFRAFHTVKGTSAFLGLDRVTEFAHHAESLLTRVRDRQTPYTGQCADLALRATDMLKALLASVQHALDGMPMHPPDGYQTLLELLADPNAAGASLNGGADGASSDFEAPVAEREWELPQTCDPPAECGRAPRGAVAAGTGARPDRQARLATVQPDAATPDDGAQGLLHSQRLAADRAQESSVRVLTERLDRLVDMVGELVIAQTMLAQDATVREGGQHELAKKVSHASKVVRELQDLSLAMRMVPLRATFRKMARLARDVAHKTGKQVEFHVEGEDTEIDRNMVDVLADPLVHMVRNAVDHGIEPPDIRQASGKSPTGVVRLFAFHSGGSVVVELHDDGRGLDRDKIIRKALDKGLIESNKSLSDSEVYNLIFAPGFSTAESVTDVSGRGVGMDVVRRNIEALRGRVDIASVSGRGSTFTVRLPLTLAITDGMLVQVGRERYLVPTATIHMSFRPEPGMLSTVVGRREMVLLRGELLPIVRLHRLFGVNGAIEDPTLGLLMIVGHGGTERSALLVDSLLGQQQVVAKSLGDRLGKIPGIAGGAIMGDGRVGLILDAAAVVELARRTGTGRTAAA